MNRGYKNLFSGFLLTLLDINIGSFDILPDFIGYLLVFSGLGYLYSETDIMTFNRGKIFALILVLSTGFDIFVGIIGKGNFSSILTYVMMIVSMFSNLILVVLIYYGMAKHMAHMKEEERSHRFIVESKAYGLLQGISIIAMTFMMNMTLDVKNVSMIVIVIVGLIMHIRLLLNLNATRKLFEIEDVAPKATAE